MQTAQIAQTAPAAPAFEPAPAGPSSNLFTRDDTFFGVCEALGEDFGFNPLYLRATLGVLVLWNPVATITAYAIGGVAVALSRLLVPSPRPAAATALAGAPAAAAPTVPAGDNDAEAEALAVAA